jgi:carboxypeptidase D
MFDNEYATVLEVNPCFNIYHITDTCSHNCSQLGIVNQGDYSPPNSQVYFNRTDVQKVINAPIGTNWMQCTNVNVFANQTHLTDNYTVGRDLSLGPA